MSAGAAIRVRLGCTAALAAGLIAGLLATSAPAQSAPCGVGAPCAIVVAQAEAQEARGAPAAMLRRYWAAIREADRLEETQRFRLEGLGAHSAAAALIAASPAEAGMRLGFLQDLASRYLIREVRTEIASDGEQWLRVTLEPREGVQGVQPRFGEVGVIHTDEGWRIAAEHWDVD